jgi:hypothetical protein
MSHTHPAYRELHQALTPPKKEVTKPVLDSADGADSMAPVSFAVADIRLSAAAAVQHWCEDDSNSSDGSSDRLLAYMVGIADANKDGELSEDEQMVAGDAMDAAADYMMSKGVASEDVDAVFGDDVAAANAAGDRIVEFLKGALPDGEDAAGEDIDTFAFDSEALEPALDAVYKKRFVIRAGKKKMIRKRISGHVRLSAGQKLAIRKAHMKAFSATARMRRARSMKRGRAMGLHA